MLYPGQTGGTLAGSRSCADAQSSEKITRPPAAALLERMCADSVQIECDLERREVAIFDRNQEGRDSVEPTTTCALDAWLNCVEPGDRLQLRAKLLSLTGSSTRSFEAQFRVALPDGRQQWTDLRAIAVRDESGALQRIVGHQTKLTSFGEARPTLLPSPFHDPLTGLPNRRLFDRCLSDAVALAWRDSETTFAVFFVDLDHFKAINDCHGHLVGDRTLFAVAHRFSHCVRPEDVLARRDGDEFTILVRGIRYQNDASAVADRILHQLHTPLSVGDTELVVTASIGIALSGAHQFVADDLLHGADQAMYQAKARGGDRYALSVGERQNRRVSRSKLPMTGS